MSKADLIYDSVIKDIIANGKWDTEAPVRTRWKDNSPAYTKSILDAKMKFDNSNEIPLLTKKRVPRKDPVNEILWIWRDKSNDVRKLRDMGCTVWDEWEREDHTIGKAYGWQLANKFRKVRYSKKLQNMVNDRELNSIKPFDNEFVLLDQVDWLLYTLKTNPYSRRIKTTLWSVEDLDDMALEPCVYETHWQVWDGKLNLTVNIRSNDMGLGNPYNIYQYSILHRLISQITNHKVGTICFNIDNAHIYDRHLDKLTEQIERCEYEAPTIEINPNVKSFYDFTINDIRVINYKHGEPIKLEVAI
ncbi:thymidylate synthase [Halalkalibacter oceani]|uniref:thymidylate synthase n=1 Tax=Halalkalibacter oceani TaxID=1653776 RepID=UPI003390B03E